MRYDDIDLPLTCPLAQAARAVDTAADSLAFRVTLRGTLAEFPGSIHWHLKRGKEPGTLEITLLNRERRLQFSVRDNRQGPWTESGLEAMVEAVRLATIPESSDTAI